MLWRCSVARAPTTGIFVAARVVCLILRVWDLALQRLESVLALALARVLMQARARRVQIRALVALSTTTTTTRRTDAHL